MANTLSNDSRRNSSLYQLSHTGWTTAEPVYVQKSFPDKNIIFQTEGAFHNLVCASYICFQVFIRLSGSFRSESESELFTGDTSKDNHSPGPVFREVRGWYITQPQNAAILNI